MAPRTLIVGRLTVQSSYLRNEETAATPDRFDTVQWWLGGPRGWRIRTYAADLDIHLHRFDPVADVADFAVRSTAANWGR